MGATESPSMPSWCLLRCCRSRVMLLLVAVLGGAVAFCDSGSRASAPFCANQRQSSRSSGRYLFNFNRNHYRRHAKNSNDGIGIQHFAATETGDGFESRRDDDLKRYKNRATVAQHVLKETAKAKESLENKLIVLQEVVKKSEQKSTKHQEKCSQLEEELMQQQKKFEVLSNRQQQAIDESNRTRLELEREINSLKDQAEVDRKAAAVAAAEWEKEKEERKGDYMSKLDEMNLHYETKLEVMQSELQVAKSQNNNSSSLLLLQERLDELEGQLGTAKKQLVVAQESGQIAQAAAAAAERRETAAVQKYKDLLEQQEQQQKQQQLLEQQQSAQIIQEQQPKAENADKEVAELRRTIRSLKLQHATQLSGNKLASQQRFKEIQSQYEANQKRVEEELAAVKVTTKTALAELMKMNEREAKSWWQRVLGPFRRLYAKTERFVRRGSRRGGLFRK